MYVIFFTFVLKMDLTKAIMYWNRRCRAAKRLAARQVIILTNLRACFKHQIFHGLSILFIGYVKMAFDLLHRWHIMISSLIGFGCSSLYFFWDCQLLSIVWQFFCIISLYNWQKMILSRHLFSRMVLQFLEHSCTICYCTESFLKEIDYNILMFLHEKPPQNC